MENTPAKRLQQLSRRKIFWLSLGVGLGAGLVYWLFDGWLHSLIDGESFFEGLVRSTPVELIPRGIVTLGTVAVTWLSLSLLMERRTLQLTKFALDYAGDPIIWLTRDAAIFYANEEACRRLGYSYAELTQLTISDIDPIHKPEVWAAHWEDLRRKKVVKLETLHRTKRGEIYPVEVTARHLVYDGTEINCGFVRDIGERKKNEQVIKDSEERVRLLLESSGEGIMGVDLEDRCTFVNPAGLQLLGYQDASELLGRVVHDCIHHTRRDGSREEITNCRGVLAFKAGRSIFVDDEIYWRRDGTSFDVEYRVHPMRRGGQIIGGVYTFSDITARRRAEADLSQYAEKLKEANRLKDLFTDILRHDLMNPASAIKMSAEILSKIEKDPVKVKIVGAIGKSIDGLIDQCESAARYARAASSHEITFNEEDLIALMEKALRDLEPQIQARRLKIIWEKREPCLAEASSLLVDVFSNLVSNAIKYGPEEGKIGIDIREKTDSWLVSVSDQGEGIPDPDKPRIFTRFERVDKRGVKGTGLGLAIAKQVVGIHRGRIWVEDNPGGGSIFFVEIPKKP